MHIKSTEQPLPKIQEKAPNTSRVLPFLKGPNSPKRFSCQRMSPSMKEPNRGSETATERKTDTGTMAVPFIPVKAASKQVPLPGPPILIGSDSD